MKNQFVKRISQLLFLLLIIGVLPVYAQKKVKRRFIVCLMILQHWQVILLC